jgi:hypothetical protein
MTKKKNSPNPFLFQAKKEYENHIKNNPKINPQLRNSFNHVQNFFDSLKENSKNHLSLQKSINPEGNCVIFLSYQNQAPNILTWKNSVSETFLSFFAQSVAGETLSLSPVISQAEIIADNNPFRKPNIDMFRIGSAASFIFSFNSDEANGHISQIRFLANGASSVPNSGNVFSTVPANFDKSEDMAMQIIYTVSFGNI